MPTIPTSTDQYQSPESSMSPSRTSWLTLAGALCLLATLTFGSLASLGREDHDRDNFLDSAAISQDFSYLFSTEKHHLSGRPLNEAVIWLGYALAGEDMRFFHLLGVVWHVGAALILARFCLRLWYPWPQSAATALLFFYTVSHFRVIHWVSAQCYILSFILILCGLSAYLTWSEKGKPRSGLVFYLCLAAGLLVHTSTIMLVPLAGALSWTRRHPLRPSLARLIPTFVAGTTGVVAIRLYYADAVQVKELGGTFDVTASAQSL
jgi:hypothetical protein